MKVAFQNWIFLLTIPILALSLSRLHAASDQAGLCPQGPISFPRDARTRNDQAYFLCATAVPAPTIPTPIPQKKSETLGTTSFPATVVDATFSSRLASRELSQTFGRLPLSFEAAQDQTGANAKFQARG